MATFLDLFGFIAVLLRAATLALGSLSIGGVVFAFLVHGRIPLTPAGRRLLAGSSLALAVTEGFCLAANSAILGGTTGLTFWEIVGANFFGCGCIGLLAATALGFLALRGRETSWFSLACAPAPHNRSGYQPCRCPPHQSDSVAASNCSSPGHGGSLDRRIALFSSNANKLAEPSGWILHGGFPGCPCGA